MPFLLCHITENYRNLKRRESERRKIIRQMSKAWKNHDSEMKTSTKFNRL